VIGALFASLAAAFLMLALAPRAVGIRSTQARLDFIRASTLERPARAVPWALRLLRTVAARLPLRRSWITRQELVEAGIDPEAITPAEIGALKLLLAVAGLSGALVFSAVLPPLLLFSPAVAWAGFVAPSVYISRLRAARRARVMAELPDIVGLLRAFLNAQVPLEQAIHLISGQMSAADPGNVLAAELRRALGDYGLGQTIEASLQRMADRVGVEELKTVVGAIAQGKRLGSGMELILRDQELLVRMAQRNRATAAASQVSTRLMAVLVGVYLPEFVILVMIPLFWGVMLRAFG
jgi:tight adherence protein C